MPKPNLTNSQAMMGYVLSSLETRLRNQYYFSPEDAAHCVARMDALGYIPNDTRQVGEHWEVDMAAKINHAHEAGIL